MMKINTPRMSYSSTFLNTFRHPYLGMAPSHVKVSAAEKIHDAFPHSNVGIEPSSHARSISPRVPLEDKHQSILRLIWHRCKMDSHERHATGGPYERAVIIEHLTCTCSRSNTNMSENVKLQYRIRFTNTWRSLE